MSALAGRSRIRRANPGNWPPPPGLDVEARAFARAARERKVDAVLAASREPAPTSEVLRIVRLETFTFDQPGGAFTLVPLTDVVDAQAWRTCVLQLRVHANTPLTVNSELTVYVQPAARDVRDPSILLVEAALVAMITIPDDMVAPRLFVAASTVPMPASFRVAMEWLQGDPGPVTLQLGVDLVLRR